MRKIFTAIDIDIDNIVFLIMEQVKNDFVLLKKHIEPSRGMKKGLIVYPERVVESIKKGKAYLEEEGFFINQAIVLAPMYHVTHKRVKGTYELYEEGEISTNHIKKSLEDALKEQIDIKDELALIEQISLVIDDKEVVYIEGLRGQKVETEAILSLAKKKNIYPFFNVFSECDIQVVGINFKPVSDLYAYRGNKNGLGVVVNVGRDITTLALFNKEVLVNEKIINLGSIKVDMDLSYCFKIDKAEALKVKNTFSKASKDLSSKFDYMRVNTLDKGEVQLNQYAVSEVVESRLVELLDIIKENIRTLTNKRINYIIITGEISSLDGFENIVQKVFVDNVSRVLKMKVMGIRNNRFSSAYGAIKYFAYHNDEMNVDYTMFTADEIDKFMLK